MKIVRTVVAILVVAGLQQGVQAQQRTKELPKQGSKEMERESDRNKEKDKEKDDNEKPIDKAGNRNHNGKHNDHSKAKTGALKTADKQDKEDHKHNKQEHKTLPNKGSDDQHKHKDKHDHGDGDGHDHGKGNAYGKNKDGLQGKEFGQHRAQEARSRQQLITTVNEHDQKIILSRQKIKEATQQLETERKLNKISSDLYKERKERIARAEQGVLELERKLVQAKLLK